MMLQCDVSDPQSLFAVQRRRHQSCQHVRGTFPSRDMRKLQHPLRSRGPEGQLQACEDRWTFALSQPSQEFQHSLCVARSTVEAIELLPEPGDSVMLSKPQQARPLRHRCGDLREMFLWHPSYLSLYATEMSNVMRFKDGNHHTARHRPIPAVT